MQDLDKWVSLHGNGAYGSGSETAGNYGNYEIPEIPGIQQIREEIQDFVALLISEELTCSMLEIGLGYYGSTHFLWRLFFDRVITVEKIHERIRAFGKNTKDFYGKWVLNDQKSSFLIGMSNDTSTVRKAYELVVKMNGIDVLFIDGDHSYEAVLADWLLYSPLVKKDGIVAFHDSTLLGPDLGVPQLLDKLSKGQIDGTKRDILQIDYSKNVGIAYYKK